MKRLYIFLNNKLISCDTIVPLVKEICDKQPNFEANFITFEERTRQAIVENVVLFDAIRTIGQLHMLGRARHTSLSGLLQRIRMVPWLFGLIIEAARGQALFLHFKELNFWPLRILPALFPYQTMLAEPTAIGYHPLEKHVSEMMFARRYPKVSPAGQHLIQFSDHWAVPKDPRTLGRAVYRLPPPFARKHWQEYLAERGAEYLLDAIEKHEQIAEKAENGVIAYMLSWMGPNNLIRDPNGLPVLFDETLGILEETCPNIPVFVKPHPSCSGNSQEYASIQSICDRHPSLTIILSQLHPIVLCLKAKIFIANAYTTTFSMPKYLGIPVIEYSSYRDDILKETNFGSCRPDMVDYFINRNPDQLRALMTTLVLKSDHQNRPEFDQSELPAPFWKLFSSY